MKCQGVDGFIQGGGGLDFLQYAAQKKVSSWLAAPGDHSSSAFKSNGICTGTKTASLHKGDPNSIKRNDQHRVASGKAVHKAAQTAALLLLGSSMVSRLEHG